MTRRKTVLTGVLRASHYSAIGKVSAAWATLEIAVLKAIAEIIEVDLGKTATLIGQSSIGTWLDVLMMCVTGSSIYASYEDEFNKLVSMTKDLYFLRNAVVHPFWLDRKGMTITGISLPKRGRKLFRLFDFSPAEMKEVARAIEDAQLLITNRKKLLKAASRKRYVLRLDKTRQTLTRLHTLYTQRYTYPP